MLYIVLLYYCKDKTSLICCILYFCIDKTSLLSCILYYCIDKTSLLNKLQTLNLNIGRPFFTEYTLNTTLKTLQKQTNSTLGCTQTVLFT